MNFAQTTSISLIDLYQRKLSPYKGFVCAHNALFRQGGCSGFAKAQIASKGVVFGLQALVKRFRECAVAAKVVQTIRRPRGKTTLAVRGIAAAAALSWAATSAASSGANPTQRLATESEYSDCTTGERCIDGCFSPKEESSTSEHMARSCAIDCAGNAAYAACATFF
jgi:putative component of membrane protein insertase Oxa1/YidC/SpoIIIJ protein YidD